MPPTRSSSTTRRDSLVPCGALVAALAVGCAGPPIEQCDPGLFDADCGGGGAPVVGCETTTGECRWFRTSVVAANHAASACGAEDLCCASADGPWPFAGWRPPTEAARARAVRDLGVLRSMLVTRDSPSSDVVVSFDASLPALAAPVIECPTPPHGSFCLGSGSTVAPPAMQRYRAGRSLVIVLSLPLDTGQVVIEVTPSAASAGLRARAFGVSFPAWDSPARGTVSCASTAALDWGPVGSIRLSPDAFDDPAGSHGVLDLSQRDGADAFVLRY